MTEIRTDRRRLTAGSDPVAEAMFRRGHGKIREGQIEAARALARIHHKKVFVRSGCSSAVDYAVRDGMDPERAAELLRVGLTLEAEPRAEDELREGRLTAPAAAVIGRVLEKPGCVVPGEDWLRKAQTTPRRKLQKEVRSRVEAHAQQDRVVPISFQVKESVRERFRRARVLASRKAEKPLTDGQAFAAVTDDYLARHDPLSKQRRARRVGPTGDRPRDRYVPAEVKAAVRARSGDRCEYPGCGNEMFVQFAHWETHEHGGDRETPNLTQLCTLHHTLLDAEQLTIDSIGPAGPVFVLVATGEVVGRTNRVPRGRGPPDRSPAAPGRVAEASPSYGVRERSAVADRCHSSRGDSRRGRRRGRRRSKGRVPGLVASDGRRLAAVVGACENPAGVAMEAVMPTEAGVTKKAVVPTEAGLTKKGPQQLDRTLDVARIHRRALPRALSVRQVREMTAYSGAPPMPEKSQEQPSDVRGVSRLVIDAIVGVTDVVEAMHANIARLPGAPRPADSERARGISGFAYRSVRAVTRGVGHALDAALAKLDPVLGRNELDDSSARREAVLAAVNGVLGDYLVESGNSLAIPMRLRRDGRTLELERSALKASIANPSPQLLVAVHGLCRNDLQWRRDADDPVEELAVELGQTALYLHHNSGRHISENGREFADLLETLVREWPVPLQSLTIVAHSMGGLVARSACEYAAAASFVWPTRLRDIVFIATPHHGAPLERGGNWIGRVLGASPYTAPLARLGKARSAGITDLRYGNVVVEDWQGRDRFEGGDDRRRVVPLPADTRCYAMAGTSGREGTVSDALVGDGLVPVDSALGRHREPHRDLGLPESRQWVGAGMGHLELLTRAEVWEQIRRWLTTPSAGV